MFSTVAKWGNSLAVRIPQNLAKEMEIMEGAEVELAIVEGSLVIKPKTRPRYSLEELLAEITPENLHREIETGDAVGNEAW
jgi:antitoxin MazE